MYLIQGSVVVHLEDFGLDRVNRIWGFVQPVSIFDNVLEMQLSVGFEEMKNSKDHWYQATSHSFCLRCKLPPLLFRISKEHLFRNPLTDKVRQLRSDV